MTSRASLIETFTRQWARVAGRLYLAKDPSGLQSALQKAIAEFTGKEGQKRVVAWDSASIEQFHVDRALNAWSDVLYQKYVAPPDSVWTPEERARARQLLETCDVAVSDCAWAVAATGSVMVSAIERSSTWPSLLAPQHLILLRADQIVATVAEGLRLAAKKPLPPLMKIITGPSMTADIEGQLIIGVHGPKAVSIVLLDEHSDTAW